MFQRLQQCAGDATTVAGGVFDGLFDLLALLEDPDGPPPDNVIYDPGTGQFSIGVDLDDDGFPEAVVEGTLTTTSNLDDGLDPGESLALSWQIGPGVPVSGAGVLDVELPSSASLGASGWLTVSGADLCAFEVPAFEFTFPVSDLDGIPIGSMDYTVTSGTDAMTAMMVFDGSRYVQVTAIYDGTTVRFTLDLETGRTL